MADYHPLIARAVSGLDKNTGENRRALYERARAALVSQLRGVEPALDETEITRERLALEEAIRKVEAEAAKRPRRRHPGCRGGRALAARSGPARFPRDGGRGRGPWSGRPPKPARAAPRATHERMPAEPEPHYFEPEPAPEPAPYTEPPQIEDTPPRTGSYAPQAPAPAAYDDEDGYTRRPQRSYRRHHHGWLVLLLVLAGIAGAGLLAASRHHSTWWRAFARSATQAQRREPAGSPPEDRRPHRAVRPGGAGFSQCAGRGGGAEGRALRRRPERSAGQALCRLGDLAHRDGVAGAGPGARTRGPRRRRDPRAAHAHDLVAAPQYRQGAAGEPYHRDHVHAAGGFPGRRHRQRARRADEAERAGARRAARRPRGESHQRLFPDRAFGRRRRPATQYATAQGARLVRHPGRLYQRQARNSGDGKRHARRRAPSRKRHSPPAPSDKDGRQQPLVHFARTATPCDA